MSDVQVEDQDPLDDVVQDDVSSDYDEAEYDEGDDAEDMGPIKEEPTLKEEDKTLATNADIWVLPPDKDICTLEEIRRGQVINHVAPNECPVLGCGKKINETRAEPSPGTISSGLRTHVLFVHYAATCKRAPKKRKLAYNDSRGSASPQKINQLPTNNNNNSNTNINNINNCQQSSLQSLIQATGMGFGTNMGTKFNPLLKQKGQDLSNSQKAINQTTSSLFSILAGLTRQPQQGQLQSQQNNRSNSNQMPRNTKPAHSGNTFSLSQCPKNGNSTNNFMNNPPVNSSLLSLLNDKISSNASSLQSQSKKNLDLNDCQNYNNITSPLGHTNGENGQSSLNPFIERIAAKTGSNIGPGGVDEAKKIIEKFATWLICSSQTIADHYVLPYVGEVPQQKPEISASDVILAYKMMQKSQPQ